MNNLLKKGLVLLILLAVVYYSYTTIKNVLQEGSLAPTRVEYAVLAPSQPGPGFCF